MPYNKSVRALLAGCLFLPLPALAASGQLILSCAGQEVPANSQATGSAGDRTFLIFDFDRSRVFHDRAPDGFPIRSVRQASITWKSEEGQQIGYLDRATLLAREESANGSVMYSCAVYARLQFKETQP